MMVDGPERLMKASDSYDSWTCVGEVIEHLLKGANIPGGVPSSSTVVAI